MAKIDRWGITDGFKLARTVGRELTDSSNYSTDEFISAAELAAEKHPNEWVVFYSLCSKYLEVGHFRRALEAAKRAVDLKPNDIRSTYALATIYNSLTTADLSSRRDEFLMLVEYLKPPREVGPMDPELADVELSELGMVADTAAVQAIRWFERALDQNPDRRSKEQIKWDLETLYRRFPHLRH